MSRSHQRQVEKALNCRHGRRPHRRRHRRHGRRVVLIVVLFVVIVVRVVVIIVVMAVVLIVIISVFREKVMRTLSSSPSSLSSWPSSRTGTFLAVSR